MTDEGIPQPVPSGDRISDAGWEEVASMVRSEVISDLSERNNLVAYMWEDPEPVGTEIAVHNIEEDDRKEELKTLVDDVEFYS